jgi:hypothetical protein
VWAPAAPTPSLLRVFRPGGLSVRSLKCTHASSVRGSHDFRDRADKSFPARRVILGAAGQSSALQARART